MGQLFSNKPEKQTYLIGDERALVISNMVRDIETCNTSNISIPIEIQRMVYKYCDKIEIFQINYDLTNYSVHSNNTVEMKFLLVGSVDWQTGGVGTSNIIKRYVDDEFSPQYETTYFFQRYCKLFVIHSNKMKHTLVRLQLWDPHFVNIHAPYAKLPTERHDVQSQFYYKADGIMIIFDLTQYESFQFAKQHLQRINNRGRHDVCKILVGNKCDLFNKRVIDPYDVDCFAESYNITYIETSAKSGLNVQHAFDILIKQVHDTKKWNTS
eukprot:256398_1